LSERLPCGKVFEIGPVRAWGPGERLVVGWRHASFGPGRATEVEVTFEPVGSATRVSVDHRGRESVPQDHVARHGLPLQLTNQRQGEQWRAGLERLSQRAAETFPPRLPD
jgi:hypothetical protein